MASDKPTDDEALALQLHLELNAFTRSTRRAASVISRTSEADARRQAALKELSKSRQEMKSKSLHSDSAKRKRDDVPDGDSSEREGSGDTPDDEDDGSESQGTQHRKVVKRSKPSSEDGQDAAVTKAVSFSGAPFTSQASPTNTSTSEPAKQKQRAEKLGGVATDKAPKKPQVPREKRKTEPEGLVKTEAKHAPGSVRVPDTAGGKAGSMTGHGSPKSKSMMAVKKAVKPQVFTESHGTPTSPGAQRDASQRHVPQQSKAIAAKGRSMADSKDVRKADDSKRQKLPGAGVPDERPGSKPKSSADNKQAARPLGLTAKSNRPAAPKPGVTKASASTVQGAGPRKTSQQPERPTERKGGADAAKPQPKAQMPRAQPQKGQQQDQVGKGSGVHEGETKASASKAALAEAAPGGVKQEQQQKQQLAAEPEGALKAAAPQTQLQRKREVEPEPKVAVSTSCSMPALDSTNPVQQRLESHKAADTGEEARPLLLDRHPQAAVRWLQSQLTQAACKAGGRRGKQQQRSRARGAGYGGSVIKCWFQGIRWGVSLHPSQLKDRPSLASALNDAFQGQILSCGKGAGLHVIFVSRDGRFREFPPTKASDPGADEDWYRAAQAAARVFVSPIQAMLH